MLLNRRNLVFVAVVVLGVLADQLTKAWIAANVALHTGEIVIVPHFLSIVHARNPGAAMGLLRGFEHRYLLFGAFTVIAFAVILDLFRRLPRDDGFMAAILGMILSGAIGNGIDRIRFRYVTDFVKVYTEIPSLRAWLEQTFGTNEWPSFNVADASLVVGVCLFLVHHMFLEEQEGATASDGAQPTRDDSGPGPG